MVQRHIFTNYGVREIVGILTGLGLHGEINQHGEGILLPIQELIDSHAGDILGSRYRVVVAPKERNGFLTQVHFADIHRDEGGNETDSFCGPAKEVFDGLLSRLTSYEVWNAMEMLESKEDALIRN